nr:MAG TPA: portal protein [Caudoviricetes sp.]
MSFLDLFRTREEPAQEPEESQPAVDDVLLQALLSGDTITREKALTLPAVAGSVDFLCNMVACMPVKLYKYKKGKIEEVTNDQRVTCLNSDTGDTLDAFQLKKALVEDYLLGKGGYAYIAKSKNNVTAIKYVEERNISIMKNADPIDKSYKILVNGAEYQPYQFIKLLRNTKDGASGVGLTVQVSKALETAYSTLIYQLGLVKSGGNKKGFLKSNHRLDQDTIDTLKRAWKNLYTNNSENVIVLNDGLEFQEASNNSVEMQLDQNKNTLTAEIKNIFHIKDDFYDTFKEAIFPIVKAFETALNRDLLLEKEKKNYYFALDVNEIVKANLKERYEAYKTANDAGWISKNEIRAKENLEAIEGMDVINVGLGSVLYDINSHQYYTPNTDKTADLSTEGGELQDGS